MWQPGGSTLLVQPPYLTDISATVDSYAPYTTTPLRYNDIFTNLSSQPAPADAVRVALGGTQLQTSPGQSAVLNVTPDPTLPPPPALTFPGFQVSFEITRLPAIMYIFMPVYSGARVILKPFQPEYQPTFHFTLPGMYLATFQPVTLTDPLVHRELGAVRGLPGYG